MSLPGQILTGAEFDGEPEAMDAFDRHAEASGCFRNIYREVEGEYLQPRIGCPKQTSRIDRILMPSKKLIDAGWPHGPIGVEGKCSAKKIGPVLAQALDYSRAIWFLPHGFEIHLRWVFLWPLSACVGDIASVMAQNRIGYVCSHPRTPLLFGCGGTYAIEIMHDGSVKAKGLPMGNKAGSR